MDGNCQRAAADARAEARIRATLRRVAPSSAATSECCCGREAAVQVSRSRRGAVVRRAPEARSARPRRTRSRWPKAVLRVPRPVTSQHPTAARPPKLHAPPTANAVRNGITLAAPPSSGAHRRRVLTGAPSRPYLPPNRLAQRTRRSSRASGLRPERPITGIQLPSRCDISKRSGYGDSATRCSCCGGPRVVAIGGWQT